MEILLDTAAFAAKTLLVVVAIIITVGAIVSITRRHGHSLGQLNVTRLNDELRRLADALLANTLTERDYNKHVKAESKSEKQAKRPEKSVYVLDFEGDILASHVAEMREAISAILSVAKPADEVVVRVSSPGGAVSEYGLAASQLERIKQKGVRLVVCVDKVAASGGYMMACVADEILAAPFSILGSIGVVAGVPNLHRLLQRHHVDYEEFTAGEFKRTVSVLGEVTDRGKKKFQEQIEDVHGLFKAFVSAHRPQVDIDAVSTGEYWLGTRAKELGLVDRLITSDDYLISKMGEANLLTVEYKAPQSWRERLSIASTRIMERMAVGLLSRLHSSRLP